MAFPGRRVRTVGCIHPAVPAVDRLRASIVQRGSCWVWTKGTDLKGYARFRDDHGKKVAVHRFAYEAFRGRIPDGLVIDHLCRNPSCCNPEHLEPVTNAENIRRGNADWRKYSTHCARGHEFTPENVRIDRLGYRNCRACSRASGRRSDQKRRGKHNDQF